jgi:uncharacterized membrane protein YidH (DUF202 family)
MTREWFDPDALRRVGSTPDYRFSLANERTFLAWVRTGLALIAGGLAVLVISWRRIVALSDSEPAPARRAVPLTTLAALGFAALGVALLAGR